MIKDLAIKQGNVAAYEYKEGMFNSYLGQVNSVRHPPQRGVLLENYENVSASELDQVLIENNIHYVIDQAEPELLPLVQYLDHQGRIKETEHHVGVEDDEVLVHTLNNL